MSGTGSRRYRYHQPKPHRSCPLAYTAPRVRVMLTGMRYKALIVVGCGLLALALLSVSIGLYFNIWRAASKRRSTTVLVSTARTTSVNKPCPSKPPTITMSKRTSRLAADVMPRSNGLAF